MFLAPSRSNRAFSSPLLPARRFLPPEMVLHRAHESATRPIRCGRSVTTRAGELTLRLGQLPCEPNDGCIGANTREVYYERHLTDAGKPIARAGLPVGVCACLEQTEGLRLREASAAAFPPGTKFASRGWTPGASGYFATWTLPFSTKWPPSCARGCVLRPLPEFKLTRCPGSALSRSHPALIYRAFWVRFSTFFASRLPVKDEFVTLTRHTTLYKLVPGPAEPLRCLPAASAMSTRPSKFARRFSTVSTSDNNDAPAPPTTSHSMKGFAEFRDKVRPFPLSSIRA